MARVTYGALVTDITGSIGGTTFQRNRSGAIARLRPTNPKVRNDLQSIRTTRFSLLATLWDALTLTQKLLWNDYGLANPKITKFGQEKILTGYNFYQSINSWRLELGFPSLDVPPPFVLPSPVTDYSVFLQPGNIVLENVVHPGGFNIFFIIYITTITKTTQRSNFNKARFMIALTSDIIFPFNLTSVWETAFGIDYVTQRTASQFNLSFMIQALEGDSGLTSAGLFKTVSF